VGTVDGILVGRNDGIIVQADKLVDFTGEVLPAGQGVQDETPAFENFPITQSVHPPAPHLFTPPLQFKVVGLEN